MPPSDHEKEKIERLRRAMYSRELSQRIGERPRHELEDESATVREDWTSEEPKEIHVGGASISPRVADITRKALKGLLIAAVAFCVATLGFFIYTFTLGGNSLFSASNNIEIIVNGPPEVVSGDPTQLQIAITNKNSAALELAELVITYPDGTRTNATQTAGSCNSIELDPETGVVRSERICLGTIPGGVTQQGTISPIFSGASLSKATMKIELQYRLSGSNSVFTASTDYEVAFKTSSIALTVTGNNETISGQPMQFTIAVASNANTEQKGIMLHVDYPFGFTFKSAAPAPTSPGNWYIGDLKSGQTKTIQITGTMTGQPGDSRVFRLSAGTRDIAASSTLGAVFAQDSYRLKISDAFLGLAIQVNTDENSEPSSTFSSNLPTTPYATPGSTVSVTIRYTNNLSNKIDNAIIVAKLSGTAIDGSTVRVADGLYRSSDGVVYWDQSTSRGKLAEIAPGASGTLTFSFQVPANAAQGSSPRIDISVNAAGKRLDQSGVPQSLQAAAVQRVLIASNLGFTAQALYHANPLVRELGDLGPLPPKAEVETTYAIFFTISNTTNKITGAKITARMPPYVRWLNVWGEKHESFDFNLTNGTVTWNVGDIAAGVGVNGAPTRQLAFGIGFTPSIAQIGQAPVLLENIVLTGIDSVTGQEVVLTATPNVTTNLFQVAKSSNEVSSGVDPGFSSSDATVVK